MANLWPSRIVLSYATRFFSPRLVADSHAALSARFGPPSGIRSIRSIGHALRHGFGIVNHLQPDMDSSRIGGLVAGEDFQPVHSDPRKDWMRGGMTALRCVYDGCKFVNRSRSPSRLDAAGWSSGIVRDPMVNSFQKHRECFARFSKVCLTYGSDGGPGLVVPCGAWMLSPAHVCLYRIR